MFLLYTR